MTIFESINHYVRRPGMTLKVSWCILNKHSSSEHILLYTSIGGKTNLNHSGSQIHKILSKDRGIIIGTLYFNFNQSFVPVILLRLTRMPIWSPDLKPLVWL